jgi:hypothetical protein
VDVDVVARVIYRANGHLQEPVTVAGLGFVQAAVVVCPYDIGLVDAVAFMVVEKPGQH